jgi:aminopeptidase N
MVASDLYEDSDRYFFTVATAHEVAHQWWYSVVGNNVFADPWLDEALTTFSSSLYYEDIGNSIALYNTLDNWEQRVSDAVDAGSEAQIVQPLDYFEKPGRERLYGVTVYAKGALFFDALRHEIGDQAFFAALQEYYQRYKFQVARPQDLLDAFESSAGRQLDDFYQSWLYSSN